MTVPSEPRIPAKAAAAVLRWPEMRFALSESLRVQVPADELLPGDVLVLVGGSGTGKSSLLRVFLGELVPPGEGPMMGEQPVSRPLAGSGATSMGVLRQGDGHLPDEAVLVNCLLGRYSDLTAVDRARMLLKRLCIPEESWATKVSNLSGGQRRRVALARTLLADGAMLVLDEPTSGLDKESTRIVAELLANPEFWQRRAGIAVTHDLEFAAAIATKLGRFEGGKVLLSTVREPHPQVRTTISGLGEQGAVADRKIVFYRKTHVAQAELMRTLATALPLLVLGAMIVGATFMAQALSFADLPLSRFVDIPRAVVETVVAALMLEITPLMSGLLFAGVGGASIAGKAATLSTSGADETLRFLGRSPERLFGVPSVLVPIATLPLIHLFAVVASLLGVGAALILGRGGVGYAAVIPALLDVWKTDPVALVTTFARVGAFALGVSSTAYLIGSRTKGGASAVATAAARSVLLCSMVVIVINAVFAFLG